MYINKNYNPEIFSFAREWYKCVTRLNMLQQTQENTPQVSIRALNQLRWRWSLFKSIMVEGEFRALWKNTQRETNTIASIWLQNILEHLSLDTLYSSQLTIFFELCSREIFRWEVHGRIPRTFPHQMKVIVYICINVTGQSNAAETHKWRSRVTKFLSTEL